MCVFVAIWKVCVTACAVLCEHIVAPRVGISSYLQAERLLWSLSNTPCNVFGPVWNPEMWPAQTIKGMPTVILALFSHYGSAAAGALISRVGSLRKWMGTDSAEMGAPGVSMSRLLRVSIGSESLFLIFRLFMGISSHLFAQFACQNSPPDWLSLLLRGILSCFPNYSSFAVLS